MATPRKRKPSEKLLLEQGALLTRLKDAVEHCRSWLQGEVWQHRRVFFSIFEQAYSRGWTEYHPALPITFTDAGIIRAIERRWPEFRRGKRRRTLDHAMELWDEWVYAWDHLTAARATGKRASRARKVGSLKKAGPIPQRLTKAECLAKYSDKAGLFVERYKDEDGSKSWKYRHVATSPCGRYLTFYSPELNAARVEKMGIDNEHAPCDFYTPD